MIRKRKDGGEYHYQFMQNGKRYYGVCEGCTTERTAQAYEKRMRDTVKKAAEQNNVKALVENFRQTLTGGNSIPLANAFELSLKKPRRRHPSEKVIYQKREAFRDFVKFIQEKYPEVVDISQVTPKHAEEYITLIRQFGRFDKNVTYKQKNGTTISRTTISTPSSRTANLYQTVCTEVFKLLARDAGLIGNPFDMPKLEKDEAKREAFSKQEIILIRDNLDEFTRPLFTLAMMTALREGDICELKWNEIDFRESLIRRRMNKTGNVVEIPIAYDLSEYLQNLKIENFSEYVLPEHAAMYAKNSSGVSYRIKQFLEKLGIKTTKKPHGRDRAVSVKDLHSCRHTFCYYAGLRGIPLAVVQSIVGHMSPEMTKHYSAHATLEDKRKNMSLMSDFMGNTALPESKRSEILRELNELPTDKLEAALNYIKGKQAILSQ